MNHILVVGGNTGREFSVIKKISELSSYSVSAYQWANNSIVSKSTQNYEVGDVRDVRKIVTFAKKINPDFVFIGQGESIEVGLVDELEKEGYPCAAPRKIFANLEAQKKYSLELVSSIDKSFAPKTLALYDFDNKLIKKFINNHGPKIVVKLDSKINSRGVHIFDMTINSLKDILNFCKEWLKNGKGIILQEFIDGDEFSIITYTDGHSFFHSPVTKNYKPVFNNNKGAQTSGMGSVTWYDEKNIINFPPKKIETIKLLNEKVLKKVQNKYGFAYKGALFGEFLTTPSGSIKFIEYNVRFGNPCSINHFNLLKGNLFEFLYSIAYQKLSSFKGSWANLHSITAYAVPKDYPYSKKNVGSLIDLSKIPKNLLYYALMDYKDYNTKMLFSRLFAIGLVGKNLAELNTKMNTIMKLCKGQIHWRNDIGIY